VKSSKADSPEHSRIYIVIILIRGYRNVALGYIATLCAVLTLVFYARQQAISAFATPRAQQQWNDWRAAATQQADQGPVQRRRPKSEEPPSLVLLRDHFPIVITATVVFTSALYAMFAYLGRGALSPPHRGGPRQVAPNPRASDE
jgi:hypothetical protein